MGKKRLAQSFTLKKWGSTKIMAETSDSTPWIDSAMTSWPSTKPIKMKKANNRWRRRTKSKIKMRLMKKTP